MTAARTVLVTGAGGFVGRALCRMLAAHGWRVRAALRTASSPTPEDAAETAVVGDIHAATDWRGALDGVQAVAHLAARTHVMREADGDAVLARYRRINVDGTAALARAAADHGVAQLLYLSSIKVNGEATHGRPFREDDAPRPEDAYGLSKWEAEQALWRIAAAGTLAVTVARAPLVYGPGVKGNFLSLMRAVDRGWPLPLAGIDNRRSLVCVDNLADALAMMLERAEARGRTYLVADGEDFSTPGLARALAGALGRTSRLWLLPGAGLLARLAGRSAAWSRLAGSLQVDAGRLRAELAWIPSVTPAQGLAATAQWYHASHTHRS